MWRLRCRASRASELNCSAIEVNMNYLWKIFFEGWYTGFNSISLGKGHELNCDDPWAANQILVHWMGEEELLCTRIDMNVKVNIKSTNSLLTGGTISRTFENWAFRGGYNVWFWELWGYRSWIEWKPCERWLKIEIIWPRILWKNMREVNS